MNYERSMSGTLEAEPSAELSPETLAELTEIATVVYADMYDVVGEAEKIAYEAVQGEEIIYSSVDTEKTYDLSFEANTVIAVGSTALAGTIVMSPDMVRQGVKAAAGHPEYEMPREAEETAEKPNTPGMYAQEKPEYQAFVGQAEQMIYGLMNGDTSGLSGLPPKYQEALRVRMNQRIYELDSGAISEGEFRLEVKKMISVACTGLGDRADGVS